jgi:hypothetical protein
MAALNAEIAALKVGTQAPRPNPPGDGGVRIIAVNDERGDGPSLAELKKLYAAVKHRVPEVKSHDPDAGFRGFASAFRYVSNCGRTAAPNSKLGLGYWLDDMKQWLRQRDATTIDVSGASFIAAVLASGDVLYVPHDRTRGWVWEFGLMQPHYGGKPATEAWKCVVETGVVIRPSQPARLTEQRSQVRIYS